MKHLDLFSGIGGFALAAKWCWGGEYETMAFCDNNKYCQELLKLRFPGVPIINDISELKYETFTNADPTGQPDKGEQCGGQSTSGGAGCGCSSQIDLITGGFPCQPFSAAGKRKGTDDDRHLWPQMFRVISEFKPRWVIAENVRGILTIENGMVFQQVLTDLESIGYEVQPLIVPAAAVNAPHRRDRIWIVAHAKTMRSGGWCGAECGTECGQGIQPEEFGRGGLRSKSQGYNCNAPHSPCWQPRQQTQRQGRKDTGGGGGEDVADTGDKGLPGSQRPGTLGEGTGASRPVAKCSWNENWVEVATRLCGVDDGLPAGMDGFKLSKSGHRVERLKGLGNAIVPQVAYQIMQAIKETK